MSSMITLKRRIKSVRSTRQITKAMELISASKMRRASEATLATRYYSEVARGILVHLRQTNGYIKHALYEVRPIQKRLYVVITSNRGLSGAYNKNVLQEFASQLREDEKTGIKSTALLIGKQAGRFAGRVRDLEVVGLYDALPERPGVTDMSPLLTTAIQAFSSSGGNARSNVDEVRVIYTKYVSNLEHKVDTYTLLPAGYELENTVEGLTTGTVFEPDSTTVLQIATTRFLEVQLLQSYLESQASEQSARMLAMKTASDNAKDLIDDLVLATNTLRQATITQELAEITGGAGTLL